MYTRKNLPLIKLLVMFIGAVALLVHGCMAFEPIEPTDLSQIKPSATREAVENTLGDQVNSAETGLGSTATYKYYTSRVPSSWEAAEGTGLILIPFMWPVAEYGARVDREEKAAVLTILYDQDGYVSSVFRDDQIQTLENASTGDTEALFNLGRSNMLGGHNRSKWMCLAAHQGHAAARRDLASFYSGNSSIRESRQKAYLWFRLAEFVEPLPRIFTISDGGSYVSGTRLDKLKSQMTYEEIVEAERHVAEWRPNPAECEIDLPN